jgi:serine/threonine protein kinase
MTMDKQPAPKKPTIPGGLGEKPGAPPKKAPPAGEAEETKVFAAASEAAEADAADFLLGNQPPQKEPGVRPAPAVAPPAAPPEDVDTVLVSETSGETSKKKPAEPLGETSDFSEAPAGSEPAATVPPPSAAKPASAPTTGSGSSASLPSSPVLGEYRLLKKLGAGGMGTVYLARQERLDRQVALKVLSRDLAAKPAFVQRFLREARVMARLDHPNILHCYDVGEARGLHFLAMEYADGGSVESWLKKLGRFSLADALHITLACARALQHAHELNLVHRDIKPDNLLLTAKGVVKLADLGLAKAQDDDLSLTRTGTGAGTPLYMAPEQARDVKHVDGRSDIYSLGCMLYRFLAGEMPFTGNTLVEVIEAKSKGKFTPLRQKNAEAPPRLELIVDKMLAANPAHRYQSCAEVVKDLEELGLAGDRLSFFGGGPGQARKPVPTAPPKKAASQDTKEVLARPTVRATPPANRPAAPPVESGVWYVHLRLPSGHSITKKATHEEVATLIKSGSIRPETRVARTEAGPFRPLAAFPELNELIHARTVKVEADRKGQKYRKLYEQIEAEDARRRRWRWLDNLLGRFTSLFGCLLWLAIVVGVCVGGYFAVRWGITMMNEKGGP